MKKELRDELAYYLGQLMYQIDLEFDLSKRESIIKKIKAIDTLLEIEK